VDIPLDVQATHLDEQHVPGFDAAEFASPKAQAGLPDLVRRAIDYLNAAERPVILVGNGVRLARAEVDFGRMIEQLQVPVLTTRLGVDLVPFDHELATGMPGPFGSRGANFCLQNSDWLLMLGARMDLGLIAYAPERLARAAKKIMVNVDEAEIRKLKGAIDLPVVADAGDFIREFQRQSSRVQNRDRSGWRQRCREWKTRYPVVLPEHRADKRVSVYHLSEVLAGELTSSDIVLPGSSGLGCEIFLTAFQVKRGQRVFHNKGTGAMGLGVSAAIGACLGGGRRRTVCVDGDGGFHMNSQDLETVRRLNLPVKFFVLGNQGHASIRASQRGYFGRLSGADAASGLTLPDVSKVAAAYGIGTARIHESAGLRQQVQQVLETPGPVVCDVAVIPDEARIPRVQALARPDGTMVSKPLEDMFPYLSREEFRANMIVPPVEE
jgi:acetolactate synthase-1/2/3 large subunit